MSDTPSMDTAHDPATAATCSVTQWVLAEIKGRDVAKFLQGQVTCNLDHLNASYALWGAHCNVKGRTVANFILVQVNATIFVLCPQSTFPPLQASLKKYGLFNQIDIVPKPAQLMATLTPSSTPTSTKKPTTTPVEGMETHTLSMGQFKTTTQENGFSLTLSPTLTLSAHWQTANETTHEEAENAIQTVTAPWHQGLVEAKLGFITENTAEAFIPIELNMDLMGGISFDKGCYLGQEIIARLHYRGQAKQRLCTLTLPEACPRLMAGTALFIEGNKSAVGTVITASQINGGAGQALAVLRLAQIPENMMLSINACRAAGQTESAPINPPCPIAVSAPTAAKPTKTQ